MADVFVSARRLYLWRVCAFLTGSVCAVNGQPVLCLLMVAATVVFFAYCSRRSPQLRLRSSLVTVLIAFTSFAYAQWRSSTTPPDPLRELAGRSAILLGTLKEKRSVSATGCLNYTLSVSSMLFPQKRQLHSTIILSVRRDGHRPDVSNEEEPALRKPLLFKVTIRRPGESFQQIFEGRNSNRSATATAAPVATSPADAGSGAGAGAGANSAAGATAATVQRTGPVLCSCSLSDITAAPRLSQTESTEDVIDNAIDSSRKVIVQAHVRALSQDKGCLLASMVLGDKAIKLPDSIVDDFRTIGLSHILAASGFNLTLVITVSTILGQAIFRSERHRGLFSLLLLSLFVLLSGLSASIVRAAIMCVFLVASQMIRRQSHIMSSLATAIFVTVLCDPSAVLDLGLELSYAATLGITIGAQPLAELLQTGTSRLSQWLSELISVCIIAQLSVLPIQVFAFWNANILFLAANLLVLPLVAPITIVGFLSSLVALVSVLAPLLSNLTQAACSTFDSVLSIPLGFILLATHSLASIQWAKLPVGKPELNQVVAYYIFFLVFLIALRRRWTRAIVLLIPLCAVSILLTRTHSTPLSIGVFKNETVLANTARDAVILLAPQASTLDDVTLKKYLTFNAVHNALPVDATNPKSSEPMTNHSISIVSQRAYSVYNDGSGSIGAVYVPSVDKLQCALSDSSNRLGWLAHTAHRYVIVRCDRDEEGALRHEPEKVFAQISHLQSSSGADRSILVFGAAQYTRLWSILRPLSKALPSEEGASITCLPGLKYVTASRKQIERFAR